MTDTQTRPVSAGVAARQVEAVRALHTQRLLTNDHVAPYTIAVCVECRQVWPCATVQAIDAAAICTTCGGDGTVVVAVHACDGVDHHCGELCPVPDMRPCPDCRPNPASADEDEEPF